jgi:hypothetical protein
MKPTFGQSVQWKDSGGISTFTTSGHASAEDALWFAVRSVRRWNCNLYLSRFVGNRAQRQILVEIARKKLGVKQP